MKLDCSNLAANMQDCLIGTNRPDAHTLAGVCPWHLSPDDPNREAEFRNWNFRAIEFLLSLLEESGEQDAGS